MLMPIERIGETEAIRRLFKRGIYRAEFRAQLRADALHRGDDRQCDAARNQAIFNRGGAGLIVEEF